MISILIHECKVDYKHKTRTYHIYMQQHFNSDLDLAFHGNWAIHLKSLLTHMYICDTSAAAIKCSVLLL